LIRRTESRLRRLLQQPGWVVLGVGGLCFALFLGFALNLVGQAWTARSLGPSDYGKLAYAMSMAGLPLFAVKTTALAVLTVLLARRQIQRAAA
jgi:O-antigen/teichoic acid export membrane protein